MTFISLKLQTKEKQCKYIFFFLEEACEIVVDFVEHADVLNKEELDFNMAYFDNDTSRVIVIKFFTNQILCFDLISQVSEKPLFKGILILLSQHFILIKIFNH